MAVDALEYDDEDANRAGAVEEILEAPERLKVCSTYVAVCKS
jgi:transcription elongation factor SPT6